MDNFKDKVVLVTGGSRGIGKGICNEFLKYGAKVIAISTTDKVSDEKNLEYIKLDVTSFEGVKETISKVKEKYKRIDILVNSAGITKDKLIPIMDEESFDSVIDVNLKGTFNMIKHVCPIMMKQRSGKIINITSVVGITGNSGQSNYSASKAGVIGLTKSISKELALRNINCNAVAPGFIKTDMTDKLSDEIKENIVKSIPLKRAGNVEDIANLVLFLSSEKASYITGQVIVCDGGMIC